MFIYIKSSLKVECFFLFLSYLIFKVFIVNVIGSQKKVN